MQMCTTLLALLLLFSFNFVCNFIISSSNFLVYCVIEFDSNHQILPQRLILEYKIRPVIYSLRPSSQKSLAYHGNFACTVRILNFSKQGLSIFSFQISLYLPCIHQRSINFLQLAKHNPSIFAILISCSLLKHRKTSENLTSSCSCLYSVSENPWINVIKFILSFSMSQPYCWNSWILLKLSPKQLSLHLEQTLFLLPHQPRRKASLTVYGAPSLPHNTMPATISTCYEHQCFGFPQQIRSHQNPILQTIYSTVHQYGLPQLLPLRCNQFYFWISEYSISK